MRNLYLTCWFLKEIFDKSDKFWEILYHAEGFIYCKQLYTSPSTSQSQELTGFNNTSFWTFPDEKWLKYRKIFAAGEFMKTN